MAKNDTDIVVDRFGAYNNLPLDYVLQDIEKGSCRAGRFIGAIKMKNGKEHEKWEIKKK